MTTQTLTDEVLTTLMAEVEGIINLRPLIPVTMDLKNDEPLTPNHLLFSTAILIFRLDCFRKVIAMESGDGLRFSI